MRRTGADCKGRMTPVGKGSLARTMWSSTIYEGGGSDVESWDHCARLAVGGRQMRARQLDYSLSVPDYRHKGEAEEYAGD